MEHHPGTHRLLKCASVRSVLVGLIWTFLTVPTPANADVVQCPPGTHPVATHGNLVTIQVIVCVPGTSTGEGGSAGPSSYGNYTYTQVVWRLDCPQASPYGVVVGATDCLAAHSCVNPLQERWIEFGRTVTVRNNVATQFSAWRVITTSCRSTPPAQTGPVLVITPGMILSAAKRLGLPALEVHVQPAGKTLVNFPTIFYTHPRPFDHTITLLGQSIELQAQPARYGWVFGDGATLSSTSPGGPYPAKDITHLYANAHITLHPRVDVTYSIRYQIGSSGWEQLSETVTVPGPPATLRIAEATPVLSGG